MELKYLWIFIFRQLFAIMYDGDKMEFKISIEQFEGPLDLMLHLIKENKLDLLNLDMNVLATQYITFIHQMQNMHLEIASEYMEELAGLIEYKSKKLLPREEVEVQDTYEEDHRDKLVQRLLEYQKFKEASEELKTAYEERLRHFTRPQSSLVDEWSVPKENIENQSYNIYELTKAMQRVYNRMALLEPYQTQITIKEISVEDRVKQLLERIQNLTEPKSFEQLCQDCTSLHMVIVTFLAILDLIHQRILYFTIDEQETIWVMKGNENE